MSLKTLLGIIILSFSVTLKIHAQFIFPYGMLVSAIINDVKNDDEFYKDLIERDSVLSGVDLNQRYKQLALEIGKDRDNASLYYKRAIVRRNARMYSLALADFEKAQELALKQNLNLGFRDSVFFDKVLILPLLNQPQNCITLLDRFLVKKPDNKRALFYKGFIYYCFDTGKSKDRFRAAAETFKTLLNIDSTNTECRVFSGMCYMRLKDYNYAIKEYNTAIRIDPGSALAYSQRGKVHLKLKNREEACKDFKEASKLDKSFIKLVQKHCY